MRPSPAGITSDTRIDAVVAMPSPAELRRELPLPAADAARIAGARERIGDILHGRDDRLLVVVGPCSIHDPVAAREYAERLLRVRERLHERLEIVMRVYFEKPRTTIGWKGLVNDPRMDGSFAIDEGLRTARRLLVDLAGLGLPAGCEFLDAATGQYYADTVGWGAIGARTTESQVHREMASGLSCPVGFKNGTGGDVGIAVDAIVSAGHRHAFLSPTDEGVMALYRTAGNGDAHLILRGGTRRGGARPNHDEASVRAAIERQRAAGIERRLIVDCSHANSGKDPARQAVVVDDVVGQRAAGHRRIGGVMLESHLVAGRQSAGDPSRLVYGQSVTDGCIGWEETERLLTRLADGAVGRNGSSRLEAWPETTPTAR